VSAHTPQEWRELVARLTAIRDNPAESGDRRAHATDILASIRKNPAAQIALKEAPTGAPPPPPPPKVTDLTWQEFDDSWL
jgi:hypothetical protein